MVSSQVASLIDDRAYNAVSNPPREQPSVHHSVSAPQSGAQQWASTYTITMRLTPDLISSSLSYLNPLKERELDLRGHKIPSIENLAVAGPHDSLDLTDNSITQLSNFPRSPRLRTLLVARNRVRSIQTTLAASLPNLQNLVLSANRLAELADLDPLKDCARLTHLSLLDNPVARKDNYRLWVIWRCPSVRFLDFQRVRDAERHSAAALFGTHACPSQTASSILGLKSRTFDVPDPDSLDSAETAGAQGKAYRVKLSDKEKAKVQDLIRNAKSLGEIARLEKELSEGRIPALALGD